MISFLKKIFEPPTVTLPKDELIEKLSGLGQRDLELFKNLNTEISKRDGMYENDNVKYFSVGLWAVQCINEVLSTVAERPIQKILDLPCGHGRVLRFLAQRFPTAKITASDIDRDGVDYCVKTFGANGVYSKKNIDKLFLDDKFDLIWSGSLITHLRAEDTVNLLRFFDRHLAANGVIIFSTHGSYSIEVMEKNLFSYHIEEKLIPSLIKDYHEKGYGYADYRRQRDYGISVTSPDWFRNQFKSLSNWQEIYFKEKAWGNHQDIFGVTKRPL